MSRFFLLLILAGSLTAATTTFDYSCTFERAQFGEVTPEPPPCLVTVGEPWAHTISGPEYFYLSVGGGELRVDCCGEEAWIATADITYTFSTTLTADPLGGTGFARLVFEPEESEVGSNGNVGWPGIDFDVPAEVDRSLPFEISTGFSLSGTMRGGEYVGGHNLIVWRVEDVVHAPEPSTYVTIGVGLMLVLFSQHRRRKRTSN